MTAETDLIDNAAIPAAGTASPENVRRNNAIVAGVLALVAFVAAVVFGPPYSNWFYVVIALGILPGLYRLVTARQDGRAFQPMEKDAAVREGILQGIAAGIWFYAFLVTGMGMLYQWPAAIALSVIAGVQHYDWARGTRRPWKSFIVAGIVLMFLLTALVLWKTSKR